MDEATKGKWLNLVQAPGDLIDNADALGDYAVHGALLKSGRVIIWSGRVEGAGYLYKSWTFDPTTFNEGDSGFTGVVGRWFLSDFDIGGARESPPGPPPTWADDNNIDLFCAHHTALEDGRLLVVGGAGGIREEDARGNRAIFVYDPESESWSKPGPLLQRGRWYPTPVTLPDGRVAVFSGRRRDNGGQEAVSEVVTPPELTSTVISGADKRMFIYPGLLMVPGGDIFFVPTNWKIEAGDVAGALGVIGPTQSLRMTGPATGAWQSHPDPADPTADLQPSNQLREEGTFVLLPPAQAGRIMLIGGGFAYDALNNTDQRPEARPRHCEILETQGSSPRWVEAGEMLHARVNVHVVLLPDGKVLIVGGHDSVKRNPSHVDQLTAEIFDPTAPFDPANPSGAFTETNAMATSRNYHGICLLLPDGRVLAAGGEDGPHFGGNQTTAQIYEPPYLFNGDRPGIAGVDVPGAPNDEVAYGETFFIDCESTDQALQIDTVVLIRPGSTTHHTDTEQRYVPLNFSSVGGPRLAATAVIDPSVAPPGYYMLWVVDREGRPCKRAAFVRLSHRRCALITDRSTVSLEEAQALPTRTVDAALYVHLDGFLPDELAIASPSPSPVLLRAIAPRIRFYDGTNEVTKVAAEPVELLPEDPTLPPSLRQRFTFRYNLRFADLTAFPPVDVERRTLTLQAEKNGWSCDGRLHLMRQPDPYMLDGATHWLSTDVRVFKLRAGTSRFGVNLDAADPHAFLTQVLDNFDADPSLASHPFESLLTDQNDSRLQIAETEDGADVFNFAICRVRYRATVTDAARVRLHFRMFTTAATNLSYNPSTTYPKRPSGMTSIATPGVVGGEVVTFPFFAAPRVDLSTQAFSTQPDGPNEKDIPAQASGAETRRYFGALLDINRPTARLPRNMSAGDDGPFAAGDLVPLAELIRGRHQCLVAEVDFPTDPIALGDNPANNDNLSQRNLAIEGSDNPGGEEAHTLAMTFDIEPDWALADIKRLAGLPDVNETRRPPPRKEHVHHVPDLEREAITHRGPETFTPAAVAAPNVNLGHMPDHVMPVLARDKWALGDRLQAKEGLLALDPVGVRFAEVPHEHRSPPNFSWLRPGELMIEWGELPSATKARLYLPGIPADYIMAAAKVRSWWPRMSKVDDHTIELPVGGVSHVPFPAPTAARQAGLLTLVLPPTVRVGQQHQVLVRQISNIQRQVIGAFELKIVVADGPTLADEEARWLGVLQHIFAQLDASDRWHPVLARFLDVTRGRVEGFGLDPATIPAGMDPDGARPDDGGIDDALDDLEDALEDLLDALDDLTDPDGDGPGAGPGDDRPGAGPGDDRPSPERPGGDGGRPGADPSLDGRPVVLHGRVGRLEYDCRGQFCGFTLTSCDGPERAVRAHRGLEEVVLTACREDLVVAAHVRASPDACGKDAGPINATCPISKRPISRAATMVYRGRVIGFCSVAHRDQLAKALAFFARAVKDATPRQKAKGALLNARCPWSGKPTKREASLKVGRVKLGFCSVAHRDTFVSAIAAIRRALGAPRDPMMVVRLDLCC